MGTLLLFITIIIAVWLIWKLIVVFQKKKKAEALKHMKSTLFDMASDGVLSTEEDDQLTEFVKSEGVEDEYIALRIKLYREDAKHIEDKLQNRNTITNIEKNALIKIGKKYNIAPSFDNFDNFEYSIAVTTNIPADIITRDAEIIDSNRKDNLLFIKITSQVFSLTTKSSEYAELENDVNFVHGNRAVKNHLWLYLHIMNQYDPHKYTNLKDALIARNEFSEQAYKKLYETYPSGLSYRLVEEADAINAIITTYIRTIHPFVIEDFVNKNIDYVIKSTRNYTFYSKIIRYVEKDEVDEVIGTHIEESIDKLVEKVKPLNLEEEIIKELRPLIIDVLSIFDLKERPPSRWKRENFSTQVAINLFNGHEIIQQGSPRFLGRQRYDIWIPSLNVAIEYNGRQHYEYVSFFHSNGLEDFTKQQERDNLKRDVSMNNNVTLIEIPYYVEDIKSFLEKKIFALNIKI